MKSDLFYPKFFVMKTFTTTIHITRAAKGF